MRSLQSRSKLMRHDPPYALHFLETTLFDIINAEWRSVKGQNRFSADQRKMRRAEFFPPEGLGAIRAGHNPGEAETQRGGQNERNT